MKKFKILLCLFCLFITCSCSAQINLKFDASFDVDEEVRISMSEDFLSQYYNSNEEIKDYYEKYLDENGVDNFKLEIFDEKENKIGVLKKEYHGLTEVEKILFSDIEEEYLSYKFVINENAKTLFTNVDMEVDEEALVDEIVLNIQFTHNVLKHNADKYNANKNIYTWVIDENNLDRNIEFTLTNEKRYDIIVGDIFSKYGIYIISIFILIVIIILVSLFIQKIKQENEI